MKVTVKKVSDAGRTKRWMVRYYQDRKPVRHFFASKEDADLRARDLKQTFNSGAHPDDVAEALRLVAGTGHKLSTLVRAGLEWIRHSAATAVNPATTFAQATAKFIDKATRLRRREKTIRGYKDTLAPANRAFGNRVATSITDKEFQDLLDSLPNKKGEPGKAAYDTKHNLLSRIRSSLRAIGVKEPLDQVHVVKDETREVQFFSNEEIVSIFAASRPSERGMLALAIFAAIRPETLQRLPANRVNVVDRQIRIPGHLSKDKRDNFLQGNHAQTNANYLPGVPDALWPWLEKYPFSPRPWAPLQKQLRKALRGKWIHDGLRHTGATNYRALYGKAAAAELLTHSGTALVRKHYDGLTTRANAEAFYGIRPDNVPFTSHLERSRRCKTVWPSDDELGKLLLQMSAVELARKLGCSDVTISKRCRKRGIHKPGPAERAKMRCVSA